MLRSFLFTACLTIASLVSAAPPEVRGTWISAGDEAISTPAKIEPTMRRLREIGMNTVYVECGSPGRANFVSPTLDRILSIDRTSTDAAGPDLLGDAIIEAHRAGLLCIGTFGGFALGSKDDATPLGPKREWLTTRSDGHEATIAGAAYLNPFRDETQRFLIDLTLDALKRYDLDGVQVDDGIGVPIELGYDKFTRALYKKETGKDVPADSAEPAWVKWRAEKLTAFAQRYVSEIRAARPDIILSVAPSPYPASFDKNLVDWMRWTRWCYCGGRRWNEYVPRCSGIDAATTIRTLQSQIDQVDEEKVNLVAGVRAAVGGEPLKFDELKHVIEFGRKQEIAGHVIESADAVIEVDGSSLAAFYDIDRNGRASNPFKAGDWRPAPVVAVRGANDVWKGNVTQAGRYAVVARKAGVWAEVTSLDLEVGEHTFVQDGDAVELLIDRRP